MKFKLFCIFCVCVTIVIFAWWSILAIGFEAKSLTGEHISGTVCSGFFKGNTIRLD